MVNKQYGGRIQKVKGEISFCLSKQL